MKIEILGTGCAKCHKLDELVRRVYESHLTGLDAKLKS